MELRVFVEPQQGATFDDQLAVAQASERLGFGAFFRSDHVVVIGDGDGLPGPTDSWVTLGGIARETSTIRLGTLLTSATFRLPGPLAIAVAQVDQMSGGRVEFGLGAGWYEAEHRAYGIGFPSVGERFSRLEEQLEIITGLWETPEGDTYSFDGRYYQLAGSPALPKPAQAHIPILVGGKGATRTPALAARFADEFNIAFSPFEDTRIQFDRVRKVAAAAHRDLIYSAARVVCCGRDEAEVGRRAAAIGRSVTDLRQNGVAGTVPECLARLRELQTIGTDRVYLQVLDLHDLAHLELIASELLPAVA